ncbi:hypothetical protein ABN034_22370 [Actinopolymorpha sp. B11F2]|uniref:hypothetical protein n=1 Tax=Actinopolymorpha sp. B11F2 TaxID=3160862 RepID=UPI0032E43926
MLAQLGEPSVDDLRLFRVLAYGRAYPGLTRAVDEGVPDAGVSSADPPGVSSYDQIDPGRSGSSAPSSTTQANLWGRSACVTTQVTVLTFPLANRLSPANLAPTRAYARVGAGTCAGAGTCPAPWGHAPWTHSGLHSPIRVTSAMRSQTWDWGRAW